MVPLRVIKTALVPIPKLTNNSAKLRSHWPVRMKMGTKLPNSTICLTSYRARYLYLRVCLPQSRWVHRLILNTNLWDWSLAPYTYSYLIFTRITIQSSHYPLRITNLLILMHQIPLSGRVHSIRHHIMDENFPFAINPQGKIFQMVLLKQQQTSMVFLPPYSDNHNNGCQ